MPGERRPFLTALVACLAGAGLVAYGSTRTWSLVVVERPGLTDLRTATTGAAAYPWLIGLALVALAGAGALPATRGVVRRGLGVLVASCGAASAAGAVVARAGMHAGAAGAGAVAWPVVCVAGGLLVAAGGLAAAWRGHRWPSMGSRYERRPAGRSAGRPSGRPAGRVAPGAGEAGGRGDAQAAGARVSRPSAGPVDTRAAWDALDRGDDPTDT
ncbi:Trp biosynthesis-associated membrane protein [Mangrovihabitans endophyticus]|uniref:Tryptophan-associated transmembrane protein (Trp_oprn_chp) n=1 Tax=Mangrovihabitans endophyticus TaxID=1751298 RepID=A0A8J3FM78_9ACTN|nr:Trp biosynthesis-associated membrane protein [Mangrovihabitans endophyticus]GGK71027.1 hypothetical protein GCM10012284_01000 [Mangrovihabitans endophyticus]